MLNKKRLVAATLSGLMCGFICYGIASSGPGVLPTPAAFQIIAERALIGFAIGISILRLGHWSIHGLVLGFLISIPLALSGLMAPDNPEFSKTGMFVSTIIMGMIYGVLIEVITTKVFKAGRIVAPVSQPA